MMLVIVMDSYQASENNFENWYRVTTFPEFSERYFWHSWRYDIFRVPKHPLSKGCVKWVVCGGKKNTITCSSTAFLTNKGW